MLLYLTGFWNLDFYGGVFFEEAFAKVWVWVFWGFGVFFVCGFLWWCGVFYLILWVFLFFWGCDLGHLDFSPVNNRSEYFVLLLLLLTCLFCWWNSIPFKLKINIFGVLAQKMIVLSVVIVMRVTEIYRNRWINYIAVLKFQLRNGSLAE